MPGLVAPVAACNKALRSIPEPDADCEPVKALDSSEFNDDTELIEWPPKIYSMRYVKRTAERQFGPFRRTWLLQELQHCLLGLVCLLQRSHSGGLQDVELRHIAHGLANVGIHDAVGSTRKILHLSRNNVRR